MFGADPLHAARLANLEGALLALLREAGCGTPPNDVPDGMAVRIDADGIDIQYLRGSIAVAGEAL